MRMLAIVVVSFCSFAAATAASGQDATPPAQEQSVREQPHFCTHATSRSGYGCPSLRAGSNGSMARFQAAREEREFRAEVNAVLADGRCEDARKIAVNKGRHELAARIRRACATAS